MEDIWDKNYYLYYFHYSEVKKNNNKLVRNQEQETNSKSIG